MAAPHTATVVWTRGTDDFLDQRYHRSHQWQLESGTTVAASSSPHVVPVPYSDAAAVDPDEAYIAALASCHMLWFLDIASRAGWRVNRYTDAATGTMAKDAEGRLVVRHVQLRPVTVFDAAHAPTAVVLADLHHQAPAPCLLANTIKKQKNYPPAFQTEAA